MKFRSLPIPFLFSFFGLVLFGLAFWRLQLEHRPSSEQKALARVENVYGSAYFERKSHQKRLQDRQLLQRLDQIETRSDSEILMTFANGEEVRVLENSMVLLDTEAGRPVVLIKSGDIWAEKAQDGPQSVLISRQGIRRSLVEDYRERPQTASPSSPEHSDLSEASTSKPPLGKPSGRPTELAPPTTGALAILTAEYIQDTLRSQRNLFFKCYTQLLQRRPGLQGDASLSFTIEKTGRVQAAEVANTSLQDPEFKRCLADAMKRIEFKSFAGEPINALFPIRFQ